MKVLIISTHLLPTEPVGGNGLGRHVYDFVSLFLEKGCEVEIVCHPESKINFKNVKVHNYTSQVLDLGLVYNICRKGKYDLILDNSHGKLLSSIYGFQNLPIINFVHDEECEFNPSNILLGNKNQLIRHPKGKVVPTGILFDNYELHHEKEDYYCFVGKIELRKGVDLAVEVSKNIDEKVIFVGSACFWEPNTAKILEGEHWLGEIRDNKRLKDIIGKSKGLLYLSRADAGGLAIWEAAALGTPTFVIDGTGTKCNVIDDTTGYICKDVSEVIEKIKSKKSIDPELIRKVSQDKWDLKKNFNETIYPLFEDFVYNKKRW